MQRFEEKGLIKFRSIDTNQGDSLSHALHETKRYD